MHDSQSGHPLAERGDIRLGPDRLARADAFDRRGERTKRLFDVAFALLALFLLLPAMILIGLAVKVSSPGPVFYRQARYGRGRKLFTIYKFRTMQVGPVLGATIQTREGDPRLTRVGRFLRRTSLDELPQFFNVLKGDMSVVGPRPHAPRTMIGALPYEEMVRGYELRYRVKPGITGLAQISGHRGPILDAESAKRRFELDAAYVARPSLKLDIWIIWHTILSEFITGNSL